MENISKPAIHALIISLLSLALFIATFYVFNLLIPWIIVSFVAAFFPFYSKYRRKKSGKGGQWMEVTAFVIGMIELYIILSLGFGLSALLVEILILVICILYMRLFNKVLPDDSL